MIKVLAVDDNMLDLAIICNMLDDDDNIKVYFTGEPEQVLLLALEIEPDVILLDVLMPKTDGIEVRKMLLNHSDTRDIPIIFLTSSIDEETKSDTRRVGCLTYMQKPANKDDLLVNIKASQVVRYISRALDSIKQARIDSI